METWMFVVGVVAIIGTLGGLIGLLMRQNSQAHALIGVRIDDTRHDLGKRIDATDRRVDDLRTDLAQRMDATDKRIDDLRTDLAQRMDATNQRLDDCAPSCRSSFNRRPASKCGRCKGHSDRP
ncbi:MAG: hypothetical protein F4X11_10740 [Acidobacteria bacterium]|nr:hypothetical protein [Acidobacteriota bacterium]